MCCLLESLFPPDLHCGLLGLQKLAADRLEKLTASCKGGSQTKMRHWWLKANWYILIVGHCVGLESPLRLVSKSKGFRLAAFEG